MCRLKNKVRSSRPFLNRFLQPFLWIFRMVGLNYSNEIAVEALLHFNRGVHQSKPGIPKVCIDLSVLLFLMCATNCTFCYSAAACSGFFISDMNSASAIPSQPRWISRYSPKPIFVVFVTFNSVPKGSGLRSMQERCGRLPKHDVRGQKHSCFH